MKLTILTLVGLIFGFSAYANNLHCDGVDGYEISNVPGNHSPWTEITVKKAGAVVVQGLNDNDGGFVQKDEVTAEYVQIIRAATVRNGIVSSLVLSIVLENQGEKGTGTAVIFNGAVTTVVNGLSCKTP